MTVPVVWLSYDPDSICRGYWDQALVEDLLSGAMLHGYGYEDVEHYEVLNGPLPDLPGAVVVVPARHNAGHTARLIADLNRLEWVVLILTGDEESVFDLRTIQHRNLRLWVMSPHPDRHREVQGIVPTKGAAPISWLGSGYTPHTRPTLAGISPEESTMRPRTWWFSGQVTHVRRVLFANAAERVGGGEIIQTPGFIQGLEPADYIRHLAQTKVAPCPSGPVSVDSFRVYEALEAACVPIADGQTPNEYMPEHWAMIFGDEPPFPVAHSDWADLPGRVGEIAADWPAVSNRISSWWQCWKRDLVMRLRDDITAVRGYEAVDWTAPNDITVLMPTSPIPANPSTAIIEETMASVQERLPGVEVLLMIDGCRPEQDHLAGQYEEYVQRLLWLCNHRWDNVTPRRAGEHLHQAEMTRRALEKVRTPMILFCEHDTPLGAEVPWEGLCARIAAGDVNMIRLHHESEILPDHVDLMLDNGERQGDPPLIRTRQWSQRPHLASSAWYRQVIDQHFAQTARTMIEDVMHGVVLDAWDTEGEMGWFQYRLAIFAPDGDMKRSWHLDGRDGEPKYDMVMDKP